VALAVALAIADGVLNVHNAYRVWRAVDSVERDVSSQVSLPSALVSNSMMIADLDGIARDNRRCFGGSRVSISRGLRTDGAPCSVFVHPYYAVGYGEAQIAIEKISLMTLAQIRRLAETSEADGMPIVFAASRHSNWPFWPIQATRQPANAFRTRTEAWVAERTTIRHADPARMLLAAIYRPRPVAPDWYREILPRPAGIFSENIDFRVELSRLLSIDPEVSESRVPEPRIFAEPHLVLAGYAGYDIYRLDTLYLAISSASGRYNAYQMFLRNYPGVVSGDGLEAVKALIDAKALLRGSSVTASSAFRPEFGAEMLLTDDRQVWHAQYPPRYPEWLQVQLAQPVRISSISIRSQDGHPLRAPRSFRLEGSTDRTLWVSLLDVPDSGVQSTPWRQWPVPSTREYPFYRLILRSNLGDPDLLTIQGIRFGVGPLSAVSSIGGQFPASNLLDGDVGSFWEQTLTPEKPAEAVFAYPSARAATSYAFTVGPYGAESAARMPKRWELQASDTGAFWTTLHRATSARRWVVGERREFQIASPRPYRHYRLIVFESWDRTLVRLSELTLAFQ
jgi:hypothetical protein